VNDDKQNAAKSNGANEELRWQWIVVPERIGGNARCGKERSGVREGCRLQERLREEIAGS